jgi:hypothetical protein
MGWILIFHPYRHNIYYCHKYFEQQNGSKDKTFVSRHYQLYNYRVNISIFGLFFKDAVLLVIFYFYSGEVPRDSIPNCWFVFGQKE